MSFRRILVIAGVLLILFLGMFSWNQRTNILDDLATNVGLELGGGVLKPMRATQDVLSGFWARYFDLVGVRDENLRLKAKLQELESQLLVAREGQAELVRLRELIQLPVDATWHPLGARVLAGRMGPNSVLDSIIIGRGYANGGRPGTPIVTNHGLVGRVLRASPHSAIALLLTDPDSRIAVFSQESRTMGVLVGRGTGNLLEVNFVQRAASVKVGELLITSGLDSKYPKGIPVAKVASVAPSDYTQFLAVSAEPLVDVHHLEEVLLLEATGITPKQDEPAGPIPELVGPPSPSELTQQNAANGR